MPYDAMTSKRSYRDVLPQEIVQEEIAKEKGTQFDSRVCISGNCKSNQGLSE